MRRRTDGRIAFHIAAFDIDDPLDAIKAVVTSTEVGDCVALRDRNHHTRRIWICLVRVPQAEMRVHRAVRHQELQQAPQIAYNGAAFLRCRRLTMMW